MMRLPALLAQAAVAGRAAARTSSSHVRGSNGFASGTSGGDGPPVPREWLRRLWAEELKRQKEAPARGWGKRAEVAKADGGAEDPLGYFANAARALVNSGSAAAGVGRARAGGGAAGDEVAQYDVRDLGHLQASGFCNYNTVECLRVEPLDATLELYATDASQTDDFALTLGTSIGFVL
jgi:hypothetical protein